VTLDKALELNDYKGFPARKAAAEARGRKRGIGISSYIEPAASPLGRVRLARAGVVFGECQFRFAAIPQGADP
jgi:carbon-monoxide dehydrogenase large subunit